MRPLKAEEQMYLSDAHTKALVYAYANAVITFAAVVKELDNNGFTDEQAMYWLRTNLK